VRYTVPGSDRALPDANHHQPGSPQAVALNGAGTVVSFSKKALSFGNQPVGTTTAPQTVSLTNVSATTLLEVASITVTGADAGDFSRRTAPAV